MVLGEDAQVAEVVGEHAEGVLGDGQDHLVGGHSLRQIPLQRLVDHGDRGLVDPAENLRLARDMVVERRFANADGGGDVVHRGLVVAVLVEQDRRGVGDLISASGRLRCHGTPPASP